jgi:succinate dehydrogenase / fumarate reductase iron-sulfur subunit
MEHYTMNLTLKVWRQKNKKDKGSFETYSVSDISSEMSFLEMFDVLNERLVHEGKEPIAFDHDCREGICGMCSMYINGRPHGPWEGTTTCQLHMRAFKDGDTIVVEPWRANAFPVIKDLVVDRSAFDRIIQAGGYISVNTGNAVDANAIPYRKGQGRHRLCRCCLYRLRRLCGGLQEQLGPAVPVRKGLPPGAPAPGRSGA